MARNYHLRISVSFSSSFNNQLQNNTKEMWYYIICVIVIIVLWFLSILIFSEQIRKSVFAEFFTSKFISLWYESLFLSLKYYQLQKFTELRSEKSAAKLVLICQNTSTWIHNSINFIIKTESSRSGCW